MGVHAGHNDIAEPRPGPRGPRDRAGVDPIRGDGDGRRRAGDGVQPGALRHLRRERSERLDHGLPRHRRDPRDVLGIAVGGVWCAAGVDESAPESLGGASAGDRVRRVWV